MGTTAPASIKAYEGAAPSAWVHCTGHSTKLEGASPGWGLRTAGVKPPGLRFKWQDTNGAMDTLAGCWPAAQGGTQHCLSPSYHLQGHRTAEGRQDQACPCPDAAAAISHPGTAACSALRSRAPRLGQGPQGSQPPARHSQAIRQRQLPPQGSPRTTSSCPVTWRDVKNTGDSSRTGLHCASE